MAIDGAVAQYNENAGSVYNAREERRRFDRMLDWDVRVWGGSATSGTANGGVCRYFGSATTGDLSVQQRVAGANMSVDVLLGGAMVGGTESASQGNYFCYNDATFNVVISASDPTNPRIDIIGIQIRDKEYSGATDDARILVITGTPAGVPAEPTLPANFLTLARVDVAAAAASITNANITDRRRMITSLGGMTRCTSSTRPVNSLREGMHIYETDTDYCQVYDGSGWVPLGQSARALSFVQEVNLGGDGAIALSSIPATFVNLLLMTKTRTSRAIALDGVLMRFNTDSGNNYDFSYLRVVNATPGGSNTLATNACNLSTGGVGNSAAANVFAPAFCFIPGYADSNHKTGIGIGGGIDVAAANTLTDVSQFKWRSTTAINRIDLLDAILGTSFKSGSRAILVGLR